MPLPVSNPAGNVTRRPVIWAAWAAAFVLHLGVLGALSVIDWLQAPAEGAQPVVFDITLTSPPAKLDDAAEVAKAVTRAPRPVTATAPASDETTPTRNEKAQKTDARQPQKKAAPRDKAPAKQPEHEVKHAAPAPQPSEQHEAPKRTPSASELLAQATSRARSSTFGMQPENAGVTALTGSQRAAEARYIDAWTRTVQRYGNQFHNGPSNLAGTLRIRAVIKRNGQLDSVEVIQSSGHPELDQAALETVREAAPYRPFDTDMGNRQLLIITRTWRFGQGNNFGVQ